MCFIKRKRKAIQRLLRWKPSTTKQVMGDPYDKQTTARKNGGDTYEHTNLGTSTQT
jgi:hypothetical protein